MNEKYDLSQDKKFMELALVEAKKGIGRTSPNPCVGCVIVKDGIVVGQGYHKKAGTSHAEIHALDDAGSRASGATAYVTLEPCSHTGKTPPCCVALVGANISRVVVGMMDPNPLVNGKGVDYLLGHGVAVTTGIFENECLSINRPFVKMIQTGRPLIIMKAGFSIDGKITYEQGKAGWITGDESSRFVHELRDQVDAILVGSNTVIVDNPSLTTRLGNGDGKNPIRVIVDSSLKTDPGAKVYNDSDEVIVFCETGIIKKNKNIFPAHVRIIETPGCDDGLDFDAIVGILGKNGITSVLVEGGARIHGEFLRRKLYDYAYLLQAPIFIGDKGVSLTSGYSAGERSKAFRVVAPRYEILGEDIMMSGELGYEKEK
ncbi:MAG: bifunctional diaminohydroxyphosphoribosylaminopyrimidine deaminase/5-amino-6-(5-phosphoribosylamino)uracil reductase RibD [Desulfotalea sp.]